MSLIDGNLSQMPGGTPSRPPWHELPARTIAEGAARPLHRIAEVRLGQGISVKKIQRQLKLREGEVDRQEQPDCDLRLSELYAWQRALDVPVVELLVDPQLELSPALINRAALVKVMKTAATILENPSRRNATTMAQRLIDQLIEIMPELQSVTPWPSVGQRRTQHELGRIGENPVSLGGVDEAS